MKRLVVLPLLFLAACVSQEEQDKRQRINDAVTEQEAREEQIRYNTGIETSREEKRRHRQSMLDEATVVCRDGTAYLIGDTQESWTYGGVFAVPYIKDGVLGGCNGHKGVRIGNIKDVEQEEPKVSF